LSETGAFLPTDAQVVSPRNGEKSIIGAQVCQFFYACGTMHGYVRLLHFTINDLPTREDSYGFSVILQVLVVVEGYAC
jgi:hypothetical protein